MLNLSATVLSFNCDKTSVTLGLFLLNKNGTDACNTYQDLMRMQELLFYDGGVAFFVVSQQKEVIRHCNPYNTSGNILHANASRIRSFFDGQ